MPRKTYKRPRKRKPFYRHKLFWIGCAASIVAGVLAYVLLFSPILEVQSVTTQGVNAQLADEVKARIESALTKELGPLKSKSLLLFSSHAAEKEILASFPRIGSIDVRKTFKRTVEVLLQERKEIAVWCGSQSVCFSMDKEGVAFVRKTPGEKDFVVTDSTQASVALGQKALEGNSLSFVAAFISNMKNSPMLQEAETEFVSVSLLSDTRLHWRAKQGWDAYANPKGDFLWQFTKLEAVLEKKISPAQRGNLEYIDLRFGGQAYIKYKN